MNAKVEGSPAVKKMRDELALIEEKVLTNYTLADAIRDGSTVTSQSQGWGDGDREACALSAAVVAATARGYLS